MAEATVLQVFRSQADASIDASSLPSSNASLCPSMDLIMIKDSYSPKATTAVKILNTIDRREVATLQLPASAETDSLTKISCFTWSPNGQSVAVVTYHHTNNTRNTSTPKNDDDNNNKSSNPIQSQVFLFHVLAAQAGGEPLEPYHSFTVSGVVRHATWSMVGKDHPSRWSYTEDDEEQAVAWR